jgi:hypothetical protein
MKKRAVIIDLIKQDLIHSKLIYGLDEMQLNTRMYKLELRRIIFEMMELEDHKSISQITHHYASLSTKMKRIQIEDWDEEVDKLAAGIYNYLMNMKKGNIPIYET